MNSSTVDPTQAACLLERWEQISNDPELADYPGRIETDAQGNILVSPRPDFDHDKAAFRIRRLLEDLLPGEGSFGELEVLTDQGVKIPDVMWFHPGRSPRILKKPITPAPDICIEISSPTNNPQQLIEKRDAYFRTGAREVLICHQTNTIEFFGPRGRMPKSGICLQFPKKIELYPKEAKARARHERLAKSQSSSRERAHDPTREPEPPER
jgi:Uma2 family endonuclease